MHPRGTGHYTHLHRTGSLEEHVGSAQACGPTLAWCRTVDCRLCRHGLYNSGVQARHCLPSMGVNRSGSIEALPLNALIQRCLRCRQESAFAAAYIGFDQLLHARALFQALKRSQIAVCTGVCKARPDKVSWGRAGPRAGAGTDPRGDLHRAGGTCGQRLRGRARNHAGARGPPCHAVQLCLYPRIAST